MVSRHNQVVAAPNSPPAGNNGVSRSADKPPPEGHRANNHRRLHTFSRAMYDRLLQHRDFLELQTLGGRGNSVALLCDRARNSVLVVGGQQEEVDCASQLLCNILPDMCDDESKADHKTDPFRVPKHPWEQPSMIDHLALAQKISDPWHPHPRPRVPHTPISRTVSDSLGLQKIGSNTNKAVLSRRKLESEDSSYDSDHEQQQLPYPPAASRSHDDVSRTPSETLRAEFEEYVTTVSRSRERSPVVFHKDDQQAANNEEILEVCLRDPGYTAKVEFALRLGYSESMLQSALMKLGPAAAENQILEELIKLQKSKPARESLHAALDVRSSLSPQPSSSLPMEEGGEDQLLLPIVIDGSNVAMSHGNKDLFSCRGIRICVNWFQSRGHKDVTVFVPMWRKETSRPDTPITDQGILTELERERLLSFTPSRQVLGRRLVCHDDRYILNLAAQTGAIVVTNDNYRDLINEKPEFKKVIEERILMYSFANDRFMPPDDPLGRNGPTLDQFLRRRRRPSPGGDAGSSSQPPCPYGKKCTYGNKCKFLHAERGNLPQKSITDKLKERSSHKINEIRAREPSRDSSPGDPVTRTKSMQPRSDPNQASKELLCRTRSTFPRLTLPQHPPPELPISVWPPSSSSSCGSQQHSQAHHSTSLGLVPAPSAADHSKSFSSDNVATENASSQLWPSTFSIGLTIGQFSVPPPLDSCGANSAHAKLVRQLTLNPTYDPRIHHYRNSPSYPFPPPPMIPTATSFQQQADHHTTVTRIASAPEQIFALACSNLPRSNRHSHLQRMSSTSDSQLHKRKAVNWAAERPTTISLHAAVSPLIGSSDGVWEASTATTSQLNNDYSEVARSRLYYHLAALFPEEKVLQAMRALPEETDPQKICAYIICLNKLEQQ